MCYSMNRLISPLLIVFAFYIATQSLDADESAAIKLDKEITSRWRFGVEVESTGSAVTGIVATLPVPMDWPEQKVRIVDEDTTAKTKVSYRVIDGAVKQMVVTIPKIAAGEQAHAIITFEIEKHWIEGPTTTESLRLPKQSREFAKFLGTSPYIETGDAEIKRVASEVGGKANEPWSKAHDLFDWVRENVKYKFAEEIKPAKEALSDKVGDCEELSSLFIAMCRNNKIPARAVWVPGHTYPEFYLEDADGTGHWYPCQAAGEAPDFGRMPEDRPILQKGDNLKIPDEKSAQRYAKQTLKAKNAASPPKVKFVMELVK